MRQQSRVTGRSYLQLISMLLGLTAGTLTFFIICFPEWRRNDPAGDILENIIRSQGLW